jgi:nitrous oxidase accessory protein NosD
MRNRSSVRLSAGILSAGVAVLAPTAAAAQTDASVVVLPGQSVQAAIDKAPAYATVVLTPGTYRQNLLITKPLTLRGRGVVRLVPPPAVSANRCTEDADAGLPDGAQLPVGICVLGQLGGPVDPGAGDLPSVIAPVADVHISGVEIDAFAEGIEADGTNGLVLSDVTARGDDDGIDSFYGTGTVLSHVSATGATGFAAASLQRSRSVRVTDSNFTGNAGFGLSLIDTRVATVTASSFTGGSGGIAAVDTPAGESTGALTITGNSVTDNHAFFPGDGSAPPVSGVGIALIGAIDSAVSGNFVVDNAPSAAVPFSGFGIGLFDANGITGGDVASNNRVTGNRVSGSPIDLLNASSGPGNVFHGNSTH